MANYHGKTGNAVFSSALVNLQSWTCSVSNEVSQVAAMGDTWEKVVAGRHDFTVSADGKSKKALDTVAILGTGASLVLSIAASGPNLTGTAILNSISESVAYDGEGTLSYGFEANDPAGLIYAGTGGAAATGSADAFHGKNLSAYWLAGLLTDPRGWSLSMKAETVISSIAHATDEGTSRLAGIKSAEATVVCLLNGDFQCAKGASGTLKLNRTATAADGYYTGTAICTGAELGVDRSGVDIVTYKFTYNGAITLAVS